MNDALSAATPGQPLDARALRAALGGFATGVTIVTCRDAGGAPVGLTVNSFNALVARAAAGAVVAAPGQPEPGGLRRRRRTSPINVLAEAQVELSRRFASTVPAKFDEGLWGEGLGGVPVLAGCAAMFECELASQQTAGDHRLYHRPRAARRVASRCRRWSIHGGHYHLLGEIL